MQKVFISLLVLCLTTSLWAQSSLISLGVRGGGSIYLTDKSVQGNTGGQGMFDFGYTYFWKIRTGCELGIRTGVDFGYSGQSLKGDHEDSFVNTDYLGYRIQYNTKAVYKQNVHQLQVEVPLMFALRTNGFYMNVGAKFMMPVWSQYKQVFSEAHINAYYEVTDVWVRDKVITGILDSEYKLSGKEHLPQYNVLASLELGYEWNFNKYRVGLGIYIDASPWSYSKPIEDGPIIEVSPISDPNNPPAQVIVHPIPITGKFHDMDFGIKVYYGINLYSHR